MKAGKVIFWSVLGAIVLGGGYFAYSKVKASSDAKKKAQDTADAANAALKADPTNSAKKQAAAVANQVATLSQTMGAGFPLNVGSTGSLVKTLQAALNKNFNAGLTVDGLFGPKTNAAVIAAGWTPPIPDALAFNMLINTTPATAQPAPTPVMGSINYK